MRAESSMAVASSAVLPHDLEDLTRILFGQAESFLREDRPDVVEVRRHQVGDLHRVEGGHHGDLYELLHDERDLLRRHPGKEGRVAEGILLFRIELAASGLLLVEDDLQLREGHVDSSIISPYARLRCSGRTTACLMRPPKRTSTRNAAPRCPTTVPVMPWKRWCGHPFCRLESITIVTRSPTSKDWNDRVMGESPRWRGPRRNFCRVFSMIPFEAFTIALHPSSWTSSTSSSRTSHATSSRSARDGLVRPRSPWTHSFT